MAKRKGPVVSEGRTGTSQTRPPSEAIRTSKPSGVSAGAGNNLSARTDKKKSQRKAGSGRRSSDPGQMSDTLFSQKFSRGSGGKELGTQQGFGRKAHDAGGMSDFKAGTIKPRGSKGRKKLHG